ncbi:DUF3298 and DUF4163 domain-containing protein [Alkaliphilus hydrothermalis]|uniref:DUF3298 domain-containing protein n=1 Tax=Alkaliphilus hydrothermalis TaxID=1482730 RepID=A0ABS2NNF4_9FIRM|nr:DUF3298 and DUF4163 domain-containing protein [Alkaliphilus hydrothermalis]MBM7614475.1 hypothetical protein [Alkaliphilus hydrothermalis]
MNRMDQLKSEYKNIEIPEELDFIVDKAIKEVKTELEGESKAKGEKELEKEAGNEIGRKRKMKLRKKLLAAAAIAVIFIGSINASSTVANAMEKIPVVGELVKVLTFREFTFNEDTFNANIKVPVIDGLENIDLQNTINQKYYEENKALYEEFMKDIEKLKEAGGGHLGVDSGYIIKTDNDQILSIGRYVVNTVGSSSTTMQYDTIDKKNEILVTLPSLFINESYQERISENIKEQMLKEMSNDSDKVYWVKEGDIEPFVSIKLNQDFYINDIGQLVISFDKYVVAPGYMGVVEFVIPTEVIEDLLVSSEYIR